MTFEIGTVHIQSLQAVHQLRKKLYRVGLKLTHNEVTATRFAVVTSQASKKFLKRDPFSLHLELMELNPGNLGLILKFSGNSILDESSVLSTFFDKVETSPGSGGVWIRAYYFFSSHSQSSDDLAGELVALINEKSRDELIEAIKAKNEELNESLENLRRTRSAKERMESELNIGREIQMSMLPLEFPPFPTRKELDIFAILHPAREVGGDFYDFFFIDEEHFCFCVGDVSGKGVPASLFMAVTKTMIKSKASDDYSTASIITQVNDELSHDNKSSMFVTLFLCVLNVKTGKLVYTNAGHNPPYIIRSGRKLERLDTLHGPVLGAIEEMAYKEGNTDIHLDDYIVLYTDGVTEAMNKEEELYSENRLADLLVSSEFEGVEPLLQTCFDHVKAFENGADQADDITLLTIKFMGDRVERHTLEHIIKTRIEEIDRFIKSFSEFSEKHGLSPGMIQKFSLSADDMLTNIISYAFPDEEEHEIRVESIIYQNRVVMVISDEGMPFNPFGINPPDTSLSLEERQLGGLGIHLVQSLMDETDYNRHSGSNVVTLTMYR